jgi:2-keto-4-pentenoate hydratase/2-oxohepta-3-ene-1,7-dioic acid hydratase in catechol pathway
MATPDEGMTMKLVRYGPPGKEKPGLLDAEGKVRDLSRKVKDIDASAFAPGELARLRKLDPKKLPLVKGRPRLGPCVATPSKFVAIGLNYIDHAKESGNPIPEYPVVFFKAETCIVGANDNIMLPPDSTHTDWEVELGVVIGKTARRQEGRAQARRGLLHRQRRVRTRVPDEAQRDAVGQRQRLRHLRSHRSLARHRR